MAEPGRKTSTGRTFFGQAHLDAALADLAARQHVVFSLHQLRALGLPASTIRNRVATGRLHRIYAGVYSLVPPALLTRQGWWMAAVLAAGPQAVLSHRSAAALHTLGRPERRIEVTIATRSGRRHPGIDIHRSTTLTAADVTRVSGIPCTTIARTLFDLAEVLDRRRLERAFDQAEIIKALDMLALSEQLRRNTSRPAAQRIRQLLEEHYIGSTPTESELEEAFLALCRRAGLPLPDVQEWIYLPDGGAPIRADFLWRAQRVVVETDGDKYHRTAQRSRRDARKDQRLIVHGFRPIRTGWRQIFYAPGELEATLKLLVLP